MIYWIIEERFHSLEEIIINKKRIKKKYEKYCKHLTCTI